MLSTLADLVESVFHRGKKFLVVSVECSVGFDRVKFFSAEEARVSQVFATALTSWYNTVLTSHLVSADLQGTNEAIIPTMGSPQGGILSPLVWNLVMNSLL